MDLKLKNFAKNFTYTFASNMLSTIISVITVIIVPKFLGVKQYSYWQLYIFYLTYIGILGIGWSDGIYLKVGGYKYDELNKPLLVSQFWLMSIIEIIFSLIFILITHIFINNNDKVYILTVTGISGFFIIMRSLFYYILEGTNRIKEYALINFLDRILYFTFTLIALLINSESYKPLILVDMIAKGITVIAAIYFCKDIVLGNFGSINKGVSKALSYINSGIKLLFANVASTLIIGIIRWGIENQWNIETFGKVSLTLSISNLLMVFVNAVGIVMFPMLRRTSNKRLPCMYMQLRTLIMVPLLAMLIFYYPIKVILSDWLPQYAESLNYMALLFPMCVFESKMSMLINTYLKTLRKEKWILLVNLITLILSIIMTVCTVLLMHNLNLAVTSIVVLLAFRCIFAEKLLSQYMKIDVYKDIVFEIFLVVIFMLASWNIGSIIGVCIYLIAYSVYIINKKKDIKEIISVIQSLIHSTKVNN